MPCPFLPLRRCTFRKSSSSTLNSTQPHTETKVYSLSQVARSIRKALERASANKSWLVKAEILSLSEGIGNKTVYLDLVEETDGRQNAKMRGIIWAGAGQQILAELGDEAEQVLKPGSEVVFSARIQFHERYGLALHIDRIDLRFMLGELERRRQITIARLNDIGATEWNRKMTVPTLTQHIALVGSPGTSGFRDFCTKLIEHPNHFRVRIKVYQSSVQGLTAAEELAAGIREAEASQPDLIVLVRGGGGKLDLDAFNDFELCLAIAQSSIPVWTGIGHESDLVVADLVAHSAWKTPTEVAVGVLQRFEKVALEVEGYGAQLQYLAQIWTDTRNREFKSHRKLIGSASRNVLNRQQLELQNLSRLVQLHAGTLLERHKQMLREVRRTAVRSSTYYLQNANRDLRNCNQRLCTAAFHHLAEKKLTLAHFKRTLAAIGPEKTMQRGFMILERNGEVLSRVSGIEEGEQLNIKAVDGQLDVTVDRATSRPNSS